VGAEQLRRAEGRKVGVRFPASPSSPGRPPSHPAPPLLRGGGHRLPRQEDGSPGRVPAVLPGKTRKSGGRLRVGARSGGRPGRRRRLGLTAFLSGERRTAAAAARMCLLPRAPSSRRSPLLRRLRSPPPSPTPTVQPRPSPAPSPAIHPARGACRYVPNPWVPIFLPRAPGFLIGIEKSAARQGMGFEIQ
jgi:hypothetical protein